MSSAPTLLTRTFDRTASFIAQVDDGVRRLMYRRAELRRLQAAEMAAGQSSAGDICQWLPAFRAGLRSRAALACHPDSAVTYDVVLPPRASVVAWCTIAGDDRPGKTAAEFEIRVQTGRFGSAATPCASAVTHVGRGWTPLRIDTREAGPARIVLRARTIPDTGSASLRLLWGDPCIVAPRSMADFSRAMRVISERGMRSFWHSVLPPDSARLYQLWIRETEPSADAWEADRQWSLDSSTRFSLITFLTEPATFDAGRMARSLRDQSHGGWEWLVVVRAAPALDPALFESRVGFDTRVRVLTVPPDSTPADGWNAALHEAGGDFVAIIDPGDTLSPTALTEVARALDRAQDCDLLYSDEDRLTTRGRRHDPHFKPDWSPELLLSGNYIGRLAVVRKSTAAAAGAFRRECDGAEEWDLFLRLSRSGARIKRLPRCLYHRSGQDRAPDSRQLDAVLRAHGEALGLPPVRVGQQTTGPSTITWEVPRAPLVSIVIPNRDAAKVFRQCVNGILERTSYPHHELVVVDNGSTDPDVLELYRSLQSSGRAQVVAFDRPFNFSAACNAGAAAARGDLLLFLNNDIEIIEPGWLEELVRWALLPGVGVVGAKLLYPDRTIQHAGVVFGLGLVGHIFSRAPEGASGLFGSPDSYRNYLAVTGACQMMRREVFDRLGGFDERFQLVFSDVVLCMEAWRAGYRVVYTPGARLVHHESFTRTRQDPARDMELLAEYLREREFLEDPYCHPELNPKSLIPSLREPFDPMPRQVVHDYLERVLAASAH